MIAIVLRKMFNSEHNIQLLYFIIIRHSPVTCVVMYHNDSIIISGVHCGDIVSVFADIVGQCKKGCQKPYVQGCKIFLGNGIVRMERKHLYAKNLKPV